MANLLYQISTLLLAPVTLALAGLCGWALYSLGGFLAEWRGRRRKRIASLLSPSQKPKCKFAVLLNSNNAMSGPMGAFAASIDPEDMSKATLEAGLVAAELQASGRLAWMSFGVRIGPLLGLMGTLIPMGPGLVGLSEGNVQSLAENMVIAFSTTVVGLLVGGLCYGMLLARRQWYAADLAELEWIIAKLDASDCEELLMSTS